MRKAFTPQDALPELEKLWDFDGFFSRLREGDYNKDAVAQVEQLLKAIQVDDNSTLPRRFVSMTWWIPTFMEWQVDRVAEKGGDIVQLKDDIVRLRNALDTLLGVP